MLSICRHIPGVVAEKIIPSEKDGIISINNPDYKFTLHPDWKYKLVLIFDDLDTEVNTVNGREPALFSSAQAREIIDFVELNKNNMSVLWINCVAGVSRSAACAKFISEKYDLPFNHNYSLYNRYVYSTLVKEDKGN